MKTLNKIILLTIFALTFLLGSNKTFAHCEIPCGIYGDSLRIQLIDEHITTIERSMNMINKLSEAESPDYNQLVRWVTNKEEHAKKIQDIVSQYFLHQRIKIKSPSEVEAYAKYTNQLSLLHQLAVSAMNAKQSTDLENVETLRKLLKQFDHSYFHTHSHKH